MKNYAEKDLNENKPFSSKELRECYRQGAERFGWGNRNLEPRSMREGNNLIGWGLATGVWEALYQKASAKAILSIDGKLTVSSATADIGTGTYTIVTQIAAETLGLPLDDVTAKLGDSSLPKSPVEGGSCPAASVGSAVKAVCDDIGEELFKLAQKTPNSPLRSAKLEDVQFFSGQIRFRHDPTHAVEITEAMRQQKSTASKKSNKPHPKS